VLSDCGCCINSPPEALPEKRSVAPTAVPSSLASICSTGPPGAACTMKKFSTMMPNSVGITRARRRRM
jgi:hypothetical protein